MRISYTVQDAVGYVTVYSPHRIDCTALVPEQNIENFPSAIIAGGAVDTGVWLVPPDPDAPIHTPALPNRGDGPLVREAPGA